MPTRVDIARNNTLKQKKRNRTVQTVKVVEWFSAAAFCILCIIIAVISIVNNTKGKDEEARFAELGIINKVSVSSDRKLNTILGGNKDSKYTIVPISDIGSLDYNIYAKDILAPMEENVQYLLIDRAGSGFSDDIKTQRTSDNIIEDYRAVIKNLKINSKIILFADGFGGVYATRWAEKYPDQIAGIIYLGFEDYCEDNYEIPFKKGTQLNIKMCDLGYYRLFPSKNKRIFEVGLSADRADWFMGAFVRNYYSAAQNSEIDKAKQNYKEAFSNNTNKKTPKVFVCTQSGFENVQEVLDFMKYKNDKAAAAGIPPVFDLTSQDINSNAQKYLDESKHKHDKSVYDFTQKIGNCCMTRIPGELTIYRQNAAAVTEMVRDFVLYVNGDIIEMRKIYVDPSLAKWQSEV